MSPPTLVPRTEILPFLYIRARATCCFKLKFGLSLQEGTLLNIGFLTALHPHLATKSPARKKDRKASGSLGRLLPASLTSSYLFPAVFCPQKPVTSPEASLEMGGREPCTCQRQRRRRALQSSQLLHL